MKPFQAIKDRLLRHPSVLLLLGRAYACRYGVRLSLTPDGVWVISRGGEQVWLSKKHAAYVRDVIREFDYYFTAVSSVTVSGAQVVDCTIPRLQALKGLPEPLLITGLPEPSETNAVYVRSLDLPSGGVVIDGGAYCGATSLLFAQVVGPEGLVIAVEADPINFNALEQNTRSSPTIQCVPGALWSSRTTLPFASEGNMGSSVQSSRAGSKQITIDAFTVMDLVERFQLRRIDGIKLDIEGAEYEVIPSIEEVIRAFCPMIIFELHSGPPSAKKSLFACLANFGYRIHHVQQSERERFPLIIGSPS